MRLYSCSIVVSMWSQASAAPSCSVADGVSFDKVEYSKLADLVTCINTVPAGYTAGTSGSRMSFCLQKDAPLGLPLSAPCLSCLGALYYTKNKCDAYCNKNSLDSEMCAKCKSSPAFNMQANYCWSEVLSTSPCSSTDETSISAKKDTDQEKAVNADNCIALADLTMATASTIQSCYTRFGITGVSSTCAQCQLDLLKDEAQCKKLCANDATDTSCTGCKAALAVKYAQGGCFKHILSYPALSSGSASLSTIVGIAAAMFAIIL